MRDRLISFADLYRALSTFTDEFTYFTVIDTINELPTVDAEPVKHGHWIKTGQSFVSPNKFRNYFCSQCGRELDEHIRAKPNYCPNCGAKMDEEEK